MKSIKKRMVLVCILTGVIMSFGCGKKESDKKIISTARETQEKTETKREDLLPDEKQMATDIDSFGANVINMKSGKYQLTTKKIKIDKAKKNSNQYIVYCTAEQESDMFNANNCYVMTYNYYDIGGWVLDECNVDKISMIPKTAIGKKYAQKCAMENNNYDKLEYTKLEKISDLEYVYCYVGKYEYKYMDDVYEINVNCVYDDEHGWNLYSDVVANYHDWTKMCGTWSGENAGSSIWKYKITVRDVDEVEKKVKCDVVLTCPNVSPESDFGEILNEKDKLVKKNVTFKILDEIIWFDEDEEEGLEYNAVVEKMHTYYSSAMGSDEDVSVILCWGKNVGMSKVIFQDGWGGEYYSYLKKEQ